MCAILGDRVTPYDPLTYTDSKNVKSPPSAAHWFGTDKIGRDIFSRVIAGARDVLLVAPAAAVLGVLIGGFIGMIMGYKRGKIDLVLSRIIEALLALPVILIGLLVLTLADTSPFLGAITFHSRKLLVIYVVALLFTPIVARTVRSAVLGERARLRDLGQAARRVRSLHHEQGSPSQHHGTGHGGADCAHRVCDLHCRYAELPRRWHPTSVTRLGAGDLGEPRPACAGFWWPTTFPALAIASLVIGVNLIADALQSVYDR